MERGGELLKWRREQLNAQDASISDWAGSLDENRGLNSGVAARQTVFHAHWHLIPRREGDDMDERNRQQIQVILFDHR